MPTGKDQGFDSQRLRHLADISRAFSEEVLNKQALFELVARKISGVTGDSCTVRLLTDDGTVLEPVAAFHADPELLAGIHSTMRLTVQRADVGAWKSVIEERKIFRSVTPQQVPPGSSATQTEFIRKFSMRHVMLLPLLARGRVIGGMAIARFNDDTPHTDEDELLVRDLADRAALAIDNARLFESVTSELEKSRKTQETLRRTEEQLRHAQKMEAVGRLAGGVAHDFNNLLSVILGYGHGLAQDLKEGDPLRADIEEVIKAAERAATLTKQLLAFSRQQVLEPKVLSLNSILTGAEKMLRRVIGEDIDLLGRPSADLHLCRVDPSQIEQVILNLVVNARDAMPHGGKLTMETANVELDEEYAAAHLNVRPGSYVMLAVSDTGTGIDKATQLRIFEPFFTTKDASKGTGLGLSTVYGIVQQSGGHVWVYSEPGKGSTFKIYFPRIDASAETIGPAAAPSNRRGSETILLVEDEDQVRIVSARILRNRGYNVLDVRNGGEALLLCEQHPASIHLLLTDVVMPQMSGPQLALRLRSVRPEMKVLCMSGYTDEAVLHHGHLDSKIPFIQKPITPDSLARKVREVLDG